LKAINFLVIFFLLPSVSAQTSLTDKRPVDDFIELPDFVPQTTPPDSILPALPALQQSTDKLYADKAFVLKNIVLTGNTVISNEELQMLVAGYLNSEISLADLQTIRDRITRAYIQRGYISSGAILPDQTIVDGQVNIQIVEGQLSNVNVETDGKFSRDYFSQRLLLAAQPVVNLNNIEQRLFLFQQDPRIKTLAAELKPGDQPGQSILHVTVQENNPVTQYMEVNNHHTPSIGAEGLYYSWRHGNLTGEGDALFMAAEATQGLLGAEALYESLVNAADASVSVFGKMNSSQVIDGEFEALDIKSRSATLGLSFKYPVLRTRDRICGWFITSELRNSKSFLLGDGFSFSPGPENGVSRITALRTGPDFQLRSPTRVLAARATFSVGVDAFNATVHNDEMPDGEFISLLLQGQWAQRFAWLQSTLLSRIDVQMADSSLLGLEQFAVGGHNTVRGYRENSLVRDQGGVISIEWRMPYLAGETGNKHELALFADAGYAENKNRETVGIKTLNSVGVGLVGNFSKQLQYQLYWAHALKELTPVGESDIQDDGVHFSMGYNW
jgi:hemolysin activation/secretion protein